jgi:hypothetical protein
MTKFINCGLVTFPHIQSNGNYSRIVNSVTRDGCYDFLNTFAEKLSEKIGVFDSKQS